jgi:hypothetical protein
MLRERERVDGATRIECVPDFEQSILGPSSLNLLNHPPHHATVTKKL